MTEIDFFGIKIGGNNSKKEFAEVSKEYNITKEQLCNKLGFDTNKVTFISYDYKKGMLTVKTK